VQEPGVSVERLMGKVGSRFYDKETGRLAQVGLQQQLNWASPRANDAEKRGEIANDPRNGLPAQAQWPTPTQAEADKIGNNANYGQVALGNHPAIRGTVQRAKKNKGDGLPAPDKSNTNGKNRGQLNSAWVEQLMGLEAGWTNFDCWATA